MKTLQTLLTLAFFAAANQPVAAEYSGAYQKQNRCETAGKLAQSFFGTSTEELRSAAADVDQKVKSKKLTKEAAAETKYILFLGKSATSQESAYLSAWSWCMDRKDK